MEELMPQTTGKAVQPGSELQLVDVWSRTSPKHRRLAVLMLLLLAVLFAGLCCFTFWLRTGSYGPWQDDGYWDLMARSFRPAGGNQVTLNNFLSAPISVQDVPIHGVIMGVLFATLSSMPLLVAILYRFPSSVIFAVMVMFLASMPWLGITVLIGCGLTALRPFRFSFRYASALLGLVPVAVYFVSASWEPAGSQISLTQHRALLYAPWVLALLGSCLICALALAITKLIGYRPGGIPSVLAMLFAIPVFLFHTQVGQDELEYRVLEQEIGPGSSTLFRRVDLKEEAARAATRRWSETRGESFDEIYRAMLEQEMADATEQEQADRLRAVDRCNGFMERFPTSRHIPDVLYLKGQAQDQRMQKMNLVNHLRAEYRCDIPANASRSTWETLEKEFPRAGVTAMASYKLAILRARDGDLGRAIDSLGKLLERFDAAQTTQAAEAATERTTSVFRKAPASTDLGAEAAVVVKQARRLREMLIACRQDETRQFSEVFGPLSARSDFEVHPVQVLLWLDDSDPHYRANLEGIARCFPDSETAGYVEVRLAMLEPAISRRIQRFQQVSQALAGRPSAAEALFCLGDARQDDSILDEAKTAFDQLVKSYPESCWAVEAKERLSSLPMLEATSETPGA
jgi:outer membrane protein assembly factor BamD (BamD/ComL family)